MKNHVVYVEKEAAHEQGEQDRRPPLAIQGMGREQERHEEEKRKERRIMERQDIDPGEKVADNKRHCGKEVETVAVGIAEQQRFAWEGVVCDSSAAGYLLGPEGVQIPVVLTSR